MFKSVNGENRILQIVRQCIPDTTPGLETEKERAPYVECYAYVIIRLCALLADMELRVGNKYRLGRKIGSGSFGDIYLGLCSFYFCSYAEYCEVLWSAFSVVLKPKLPTWQSSLVVSYRVAYGRLNNCLINACHS